MTMLQCQVRLRVSIEHSTQCESRDSNPDGFPHWILSPVTGPAAQSASSQEWHRAATTCTKSAREYDRYYDSIIDPASGTPSSTLPLERLGDLAPLSLHRHRRQSAIESHTRHARVQSHARFLSPTQPARRAARSTSARVE